MTLPGRSLRLVSAQGLEIHLHGLGPAPVGKRHLLARYIRQVPDGRSPVEAQLHVRGPFCGAGELHRQTRDGIGPPR